MSLMFVFLYIFFLPLSFLAADDAVFTQGYRLLHESRYQEALSQLLSIKQKNATLYWLLAYCYEHLGHEVIAKGYKEKAFVAGTFAQKYWILDQKTDASGDAVFDYYTKKIINIVYAAAVSIPLWVLQFLFLLFLFLILFYNMRLAFSFVLLLLLLIGAVGIKIQYDAQKAVALVIVENAKVYLVPQEDSPVLFLVSKGEKLLVFDKKVNFLKVSSTKGTGWIAEGDMFQIVSL